MAKPKRKPDDLFGQIATFNALRIASRKAVLGKRKKPGASAFFSNLERELLRLERELRDGSYRPGRYVEILIKEPKERRVSAAPFRDRIVHHALCAVIFPLFEPGFIGNTFANRTGKGTHRGFQQGQHGNAVDEVVRQHLGPSPGIGAAGPVEGAEGEPAGGETA